MVLFNDINRGSYIFHSFIFTKNIGFFLRIGLGSIRSECWGKMIKKIDLDYDNDTIYLDSEKIQIVIICTFFTIRFIYTCLEYVFTVNNKNTTNNDRLDPKVFRVSLKNRKIVFRL